MERVVIIDDDEALQKGFSIVLRSAGKYEVVNSYGTSEEAIARLKKDSPSIILMDIDMPGMGGIEGTKKIKSILPKTEVIVITSHDDNVDLILKAIEAGAVGFITKNSSDFFLKLISAIEEMRQGGAPLSPDIARKFIQSFQRNQQSPLTSRETKVMELFASGKSYSEIAEQLFISKTTVRAHIRNIYEKLEVNKKSHAIAVATAQKLI